MKKNRILIALLIILIGLAIFFYLRTEKSTLTDWDADFAIHETEEIDSFTISQDSTKVKLYKTNRNWYFNNHIPVRKRAVEQFFNVLQDLRIEAPAPKKNKHEIIDLVKQNPLEVTIYKKGKKLKDYWVEDSQYKKGSTYMLMKGSNNPYLMSIPGYRGDLAHLYRTTENYWRDKTLFDVSGIDIQMVRVNYPGKAESSFQLDYKRNDKFILKELPSGKKVKKFNKNRASRYLSYFGNIRFNRIIREESDELIDSLRSVSPFCVIEVENLSDNTAKLEAYRKLSGGKEDAFGEKTRYDLNFLYGIYNNSDDVLLIKYTEIDPLFKEISYFQ